MDAKEFRDFGVEIDSEVTVEGEETAVHCLQRNLARGTDSLSEDRESTETDELVDRQCIDENQSNGIRASKATVGRNGKRDLIASQILIVDDEEINIMMVKRYLVDAGYENVVSTVDAVQGLAIAEKSRPDLILLDINMPKLNGLDFLKAMNSDDDLRNIPVLVLTAATDPDIKVSALDLGANDFLTKPVDPHDMIPRVRNALTIKRHCDQILFQKMQLEILVQQRTKELYQSRQQVILSLARAAEHRDNETGNHVLRVGYYAGVIAKQLGWSGRDVEMIQQAAQLHDVGKIGVPDNILFKPGKLDQGEYDLMKNHCSLGKNIISPFASVESDVLRSHTRLGENILHVTNSPLMMMAARIAQTHHEHWDGSGYPLGLAGTDIPIEGRVTAVADVFDALSSKRPYKEPFSRKKCFSIMTDLRGAQFDPEILDAFFDCSKTIVEIQLAFMDD